MKKSSTWPAGEDGIIAKILSLLPKNDKWCVEFGAWDGVYLSNTHNLIKNKNYSAVLIEGDKSRFKDLQRNYAKNPKAITLNRFVGFNRKDNLDQILKKTPIPTDFDYLCIDIDGNDYHVWKAMTKYKPKVVCIEFNSTVPTEVDFVQPADPSVNQGASLLSLVELGKKKDYELVAVLPINAFFVRSKYFPRLKIKDNRLETLRTVIDNTYIFMGYDGKIFLHGRKKLPWHGIEIDESKIQPLPIFLRKFPANYTIFEKTALAIYVLLTRPGFSFRKLFRRFWYTK